MKKSKFIFILFLLILSPLSLVAQSVVSNVRAMQEGRKVVLLYDLSKDTEIQQVQIEVGGRSRVIPSSCLSGDVGKKVRAGNDRRIVYNVLADYQDGLRSDDIWFIIEDNSTPVHNGHEYVDLGLSVKWATCNVGASKPEEYGDYFAWGETRPKSTYHSSTYKWSRGDDNNLTKYNTKSGYGTADNKKQLDLSDDAARANWGGSWRMPTHDEWTELRKKCKWTWITQNGVIGYKVTSKKNGRSIFLPAAGVRDTSSLDYSSRGYYWSSSLNTDYPYGARGVNINSSDVDRKSYYREFGRSVRPVCP